MPTTLGTLAGVKLLLGIPSADTSRDAELTSLIASSNRTILRRTRIALADATIVGELHTAAREGAFIYTDQRPINPAIPITVEGRVSGATSWATLSGDLEDAWEGRIRILGYGGFGWPPTFASRIPAFGWRRPRWDVIRIGYGVLAATNVEDLAGGANALAAYWSSAGVTGSSATDETVGQVSESRGAGGGLPDPVSRAIAGYTQRIRVAR